MSDKLERKDIDKTKIDWNAHAAYWDEFDEARDYTDQIFALLSKKITLDGLNILDFGCGTGLLTDQMQPLANQIVAVDSAEKMIEVLDAKQYANVKSICSELTDECIEANTALQQTFDLITASSVCAFCRIIKTYSAVLNRF